MKPIHNFTASGIAMTVSGLLCFLLSFNAFIDTANNAVHGMWDAIAPAALGMMVFAAFSALFLFTANRLMSKVWSEDGYLYRAGMVGGFYKEIAIDDIRRVVIRRMWRECDFICFADTSPDMFDRVRKNSYICIPLTDSNLEFVRTFWNGEIEETKE